jgi:hypothetical protein
MGGACIACVQTRGIYRVLMRKRPLEDPGIDERIILRWILRQCEGAICWIDPAQDRGRSRAVVNAVMNLRVP